MLDQGLHVGVHNHDGEHVRVGVVVIVVVIIIVVVVIVVVLGVGNGYDRLGSQHGEAHEVQQIKAEIETV